MHYTSVSCRTSPDGLATYHGSFEARIPPLQRVSTAAKTRARASGAGRGGTGETGDARCAARRRREADFEAVLASALSERARVFTPCDVASAVQFDLYSQNSTQCPWAAAAGVLTLVRLDLRSTGSCARQEQNRSCNRRHLTTTQTCYLDKRESVTRNISRIPSRVVVTVTACQSVSNLETDVLS